jgi:hypothetical protein
LYDFRNTPSEPPDFRISIGGIARALEMKFDEAKSTDYLIEEAFVRSWRVGRIKFCKLTAFGMAELEKKTERWEKAEVFSTSRIGLEVTRKAVKD